MKAFINHIFIQFKLGLRDKTTLIDFYILPIAFYLIMGSVFEKINPVFKDTLIISMTVFSVTLGGLLGVSSSLAELHQTGAIRSFHVLGIPSYSILLTNALGKLLHSLITSLFIVFTSPLIFNAKSPSNIIEFIAVLFLFILATISVGTFIGIALKAHIGQMISIAIFLFSVMLSGIMFPVSMLPKYLANAGMILPSSIAVQSMQNISFGISTKLNPFITISALLFLLLFFSFVSILKFNRINKESI